jgi:hypothetical protein
MRLKRSSCSKYAISMEAWNVSRSRFDRNSMGKWRNGAMTTGVVLSKYNGHHARASIGFSIM